MGADDAPWLSVLVPARDVAPWVVPCLDSLLAQDLRGVEVLVLDDASTDATPALVARRAGAHAQVRLLSNATAAGVARARNRLLDEARGAYCWFLDADDLMAPDAIASLHSVVERDAPALVLCDYRVHRESGALRRLRDRPVQRTFDGDASALSAADTRAAGMLLSEQMHVWSKIATRELWTTARFPLRSAFEDIGPSLRLALHAASATYVPADWIRYRQRAGSLMHTPAPERLGDLLDALDDVRELTAGARDRLAFASAYFRARAFAALVRRARRARGHAASQAAIDAARSRFRAHFPTGIGDVLHGCILRGHAWRAWRLRRTLAPWLRR